MGDKLELKESSCYMGQVIVEEATSAPEQLSNGLVTTVKPDSEIQLQNPPTDDPQTLDLLFGKITGSNP